MRSFRTKFLKKKVLFSVLFILSLLTHLATIPISKYFSSFKYNNIEFIDNPKVSVLWASLNLTNYEINNGDYYHNETIPIEGRLYSYLEPYGGLNDYEVSLYIDGDLMTEFNDTTHNDGNFRINFTIPFDLDIYQTHKLEVNVTDSGINPFQEVVQVHNQD